MSPRRKPDCTCGSPWWNHHEPICAREYGEVEENPADFTVCCDPALSILDKPCATCPLGVRRAA